MKIAITSQSQIKNQAIQGFFYQIEPENIIFEHYINDQITPNQPLDNGGKHSCLTRVLNINIDKYDYVVSVENYIDTKLQCDFCYVLLYKGQQPQYGISSGIPCDPDLYQKMMQQKLVTTGCKGVDKTYGEFEAEVDDNILINNWMKKYGFDRHDQIIEALDEAFTPLKISNAGFYQQKKSKRFARFKACKFWFWRIA